MGARLSPRVRAGLIAAVVAALVIDFVYYTGFYASDDIAYLAAAQQLATGSSDPVPPSMLPELTAARLGMTVPNGLVYWLTGGSPEGVAWFFVLCHLALVVDGGGAGLIQLVAVRGERSAPALPLALLRGSATVREFGGGHLVVWRNSDEIVLPVPERGGFRTAPDHPGARLPEGSRGAEVARAHRKVALAAGAAATALSLELAADQPVATFRLRIHVEPDGAGALVVGPLAAAGSP